jgi:hypothetical protein
MSYMQELEARLERLLSGIAEKDIIIREVKAIALESYRNGQKAGQPARANRGRSSCLLGTVYDGRLGGALRDRG